MPPSPNTNRRTSRINRGDAAPLPAWLFRDPAGRLPTRYGAVHIHFRATQRIARFPELRLAKAPAAETRFPPAPDRSSLAECPLHGAPERSFPDIARCAVIQFRQLFSRAAAGRNSRMKALRRLRLMEGRARCS